MGIVVGRMPVSVGGVISSTLSFGLASDHGCLNGIELEEGEVTLRERGKHEPGAFVMAKAMNPVFAAKRKVYDTTGWRFTIQGWQTYLDEPISEITTDKPQSKLNFAVGIQQPKYDLVCPASHIPADIVSGAHRKGIIQFGQPWIRKRHPKVVS